MSVGVVTPERVARLLLTAYLASFALPLRAAADTPLIYATTVPQHAVAPKLPAILHNEFEGSYDAVAIRQATEALPRVDVSADQLPGRLG